MTNRECLFGFVFRMKALTRLEKRGRCSVEEAGVAISRHWGKGSNPSGHVEILEPNLSSSAISSFFLMLAAALPQMSEKPPNVPIIATARAPIPGLRTTQRAENATKSMNPKTLKIRKPLALFRSSLIFSWRATIFACSDMNPGISLVLRSLFWFFGFWDKTLLNYKDGKACAIVYLELFGRVR